MNIRALFDPSKGPNRRIEKVIAYAAKQEEQLKAEISEYVVTDSIEEQFRKLLDRMQLAMESGSENEIGVWVSGFYGSGKSSFTKYLGFAFDEGKKLDNVPFLKRLQDRLNTPQVRALVGAVVQRYPAEVVMLDLASEMLAGATMEDVSSVLYYKVLEWAGYSRNLKVAALERRIERDGRTAEFEAKVQNLLPGMTWKDIQNDPLAVDALIPQLVQESLAVLTKPNQFAQNITSADATEAIQELLPNFQLAETTSAVTTRLIEIISIYDVKGKQVHDANIVATMQTYGLSNLLTANPNDFQRYQNRVTVFRLDTIQTVS